MRTEPQEPKLCNPDHATDSDCFNCVCPDCPDRRCHHVDFLDIVE